LTRTLKDSLPGKGKTHGINVEASWQPRLMSIQVKR